MTHYISPYLARQTIVPLVIIPLCRFFGTWQVRTKPSAGQSLRPQWARTTTIILSPILHGRRYVYLTATRYRCSTLGKHSINCATHSTLVTAAPNIPGGLSARGHHPGSSAEEI